MLCLEALGNILPGQRNGQDLGDKVIGRWKRPVQNAILLQASMTAGNAAASACLT